MSWTGVLKDIVMVHLVRQALPGHGADDADACDDHEAYVMWWWLGCRGLQGLVQSCSAFAGLGWMECRSRFCRNRFPLHSIQLVMRSRAWLRDAENLMFDEDAAEGMGSFLRVPLLNHQCRPCLLHERNWHFEARSEELYWVATSHVPSCRCSECDWMRHEGWMAV
jgi:hypothetical protein